GGNASSTSMPPIASASNLPRKYPASMPSAAPKRRPIRGESNPTVSELRAPKISRESMSRPSPSVPSQCCASGGMGRASMSMSVGLWIGRKFASAAATTTIAIHASAAQNTFESRRRRRGATATSTAVSSTAMADPRVEHGVEHVDREIEQHEADRDEQHDALQDDEIPRVDGADQQATDARQREDRLHDDRAADQPPDVDAAHGHERERGGLERMHQEDAGGAQSLGLGHGDVILLQRRDHVAAEHPHQHRPFAERQRQRRQHETLQVAERILLERHPAGGRQE